MKVLEGTLNFYNVVQGSGIILAQGSHCVQNTVLTEGPDVGDNLPVSIIINGVSSTLPSLHIIMKCI